MGKLDGKTALVSGAGRGIGRSIALKLANEGARVVVNDLDGEPVRAVAADIVSAGGAAVAVPGSVTDEGFADRFVGTAVDAYGGIDIIVNNAGYTWDSVIQKMSDDQWQAMIDVHLKSPFEVLRSAQPVISAAAKRERAQGRTVHRKVVNISSMSGVYGQAGQVNYSAAKAGVVGLTKALAKEWGRYSVTVNCVAFGVIRTRLTEAASDAGAAIAIEGQEIAVGVNPQLLERLEAAIPLGRMGTVEEAAGAAALFTYPEADYVSGQVIIAGGGFEG